MNTRQKIKDNLLGDIKYWQDVLVNSNNILLKRVSNYAIKKRHKLIRKLNSQE